MHRHWWTLAIASLVCTAAIGPAKPLALSTVIERGTWELRELQTANAPRKFCLTDPATLLQIQHGMTNCTHAVIDDRPMEATVHYSCPGAGHGRTTLRLESGHRLQLETQGIDHGAPFAARYEGVKTGACSSASSSATLGFSATAGGNGRTRR